jgi:hypothetical protein
VSIYTLINDATLFIYLFLHLAVPLGSVRGTPEYRGTPVGNHCSTSFQHVFAHHPEALYIPIVYTVPPDDEQISAGIM